MIEFFLDISKAILESDVDPSAAALPENFAAGFSEDSLIQAFVSAPKTPEELEKEFPAREPDRNKETGGLGAKSARPSAYKAILPDQQIYFRSSSEI